MIAKFNESEDIGGQDQGPVQILYQGWGPVQRGGANRHTETNGQIRWRAVKYMSKSNGRTPNEIPLREVF